MALCYGFTNRPELTGSPGTESLVNRLDTDSEKMRSRC